MMCPRGEYYTYQAFPVENKLNVLLEQADQIRQDSINDHVRNDLGVKDGKVNKLVSASLLASITQNNTVNNDFEHFFEHNAEASITSNKRALEILGVS